MAAPSLLPHLLDRSAQARPDAEAVRCRGRVLSYGDLDRMANGVARALADGGVGRGDRVAVLAPKSPEVVACLYGAMRAGAAYVPLDPHQPVVRAAAIATDCEVAAVVATAERARALLEALGGLGQHRPRLILLLDGGGGDADALGVPAVTFVDATADPSASPPALGVTEQDLAYVLYTSGSTGAPKGVMLTHRNALTFVVWAADAIGSFPADRFASHAPFHFDLSIFDLYVAAHGGATVALVPEEAAFLADPLVRFIGDERITVWYSVPSVLVLLSRLAPEPGSLSSLRAVVFAGEVFPTPQLRRLRELVPGASMWNLYGPTETNVCTAYEVHVHGLPEGDAPIPIGRAIDGLEVFAIRDDGSPAAIGEAGELYVRGPSVMVGYWNRPDATADVLVPDPRPGAPDGTVYRTGDLVRGRPDGSFDFLGRRDHQVKSRGYRIELGEIEAALHGLPSLADAVAVAVPHPAWGTAIVAYVVPAAGSAVREIEVKRHVARRLPRYMVPARVRVVAALPRTSTGKIDRRAIEADAAGRSRASSGAPDVGGGAGG